MQSIIFSFRINGNTGYKFYYNPGNGDIYNNWRYAFYQEGSMNTKISVVIVMVIMLFICSQGNIVNAETVKIDTNRFKTVVIEKGKKCK